MFIIRKELIKPAKILNKADAEAANKTNKDSINKLAKERGLQIIEEDTRHVIKAK